MFNESESFEQKNEQNKIRTFEINGNIATLEEHIVIPDSELDEKEGDIADTMKMIKDLVNSPRLTVCDRDTGEPLSPKDFNKWRGKLWGPKDIENQDQELIKALGQNPMTMMMQIEFILINLLSTREKTKKEAESWFADYKTILSEFDRNYKIKGIFDADIYAAMTLEKKRNFMKRLEDLTVKMYQRLSSYL